MTRAPKTLLTLALLGASLLASCGGDDALSQPEFEKRGNAACQKFFDDFESLPEPQSIADIDGYADKAAPLFDKLIEDLKAIEPPEKVAADYDKFVDTADKARGRLSDLQKAAKAKDEPRLQELSEAADAEDKTTDDLARKLGLDTCTQ